MTDRRAALLSIHLRVLAGDPAASSELFEAIQRPLVGVLMKAYRRRQLSVDDASDLATDAVVEYLMHPEKFDPARSSLFSFLAMMAKGDALNLLHSLGRERAGTQRFVELSNLDRNIQSDEVAHQLDAETILRRFGTQLIDDEYDAEVLRLMLIGEKETEVYAAAIGMHEAPAAQRNAAVKQRRDKLEKRLLRLRAQL